MTSALPPFQEIDPENSKPYPRCESTPKSLLFGHLTHLLTHHLPEHHLPQSASHNPNTPFTQTHLLHTRHEPSAIPGHKPSNQTQLRATITNPQPKSNLNPPKHTIHHTILSFSPGHQHKKIQISKEELSQGKTQD